MSIPGPKTFGCYLGCWGEPLFGNGKQQTSECWKSLCRGHKVPPWSRQYPWEHKVAISTHCADVTSSLQWKWVLVPSKDMGSRELSSCVSRRHMKCWDCSLTGFLGAGSPGHPKGSAGSSYTGCTFPFRKSVTGYLQAHMLH